MPVPTADLNHLAAEMTDPGSVRRSAAASQARYCLYPGFGVRPSSIEAPVNEVLALQPGRPSQPLTVRQVLSVGFTDPVLTYGHSRQQVSRVDRADAARARERPRGRRDLPDGRGLAAGRRAADRRAVQPGAGHRRMGDEVPARQRAAALRATGSGAGSDRDLAGHPRRQPPGQRTPKRTADRSRLRRGAGPQHRRHGLELPWPVGRCAHRVVRAAAHRRRVPAGQGHDGAARTKGKPDPEGSLGHVAELADHRHPARRGTRHPGAERPPAPGKAPGARVNHQGGPPQSSPVCTTP